MTTTPILHILLNVTQETCEHCGESDDLREVDNSDPQSGYYDVLLLCPTCRDNFLDAEAYDEDR